MDSDGSFATYKAPLAASKFWLHSMAEVNPSVDAKSTSVKLEMEKGTPLWIRVTDAERSPIRGYRISGQVLSSHWGDAIDEPRFEVFGLAPDQSRTILILHTDRQLGAVLRVDSGSDRSKELTVRLRRCGTIRGRMVDGRGDPLADVRVQVNTHPIENYNARLENGCKTDDAGRFEFTMVPPGKYWLQQYGVLLNPNDAIRFVAESGKTTDLGTIKIDQGKLLSSKPR